MLRESIYKRYRPSLSPQDEDNLPGYWFAFSSNRLLMHTDGGRMSVPLVEDLSALGLAPVRTQYLGNLEGRSCHSAELAPDTAAPGGTSFSELRLVYDAVDEDIFLLAGRALQIVTWDQTNQYCSRCGHGTEAVRDERAKKCPRCGLTSYPRLSPAIIVAVTRGDRLLLGRRAGFRGNMRTVLAGFVEPGETLEECVQREVMEETGILVNEVKYLGSQPWPFPNSLMVGFSAEYESGEIKVDGVEMSEAGWYDAGNLPDVPPKMTIARDLIDWFVQQHPGPTSGSVGTQ